MRFFCCRVYYLPLLENILTHAEDKTFDKFYIYNTFYSADKEGQSSFEVKNDKNTALVKIAFM